MTMPPAGTAINGPKVKIARIITRLNIGGPAIHAILLTEGINDERFESRLVSGSPDPSEGDMSGLAVSKHLDVYMIPELHREIGPADITAFFKLLAYFRRTKPDIVHTHTAKAGTLGRLAAAISGVPVRVHTFHGHIFDGYFSPFKAKIFLYVERFLAVLTNKVIVVSEKIRDEIVDDLKIVKNDKCITIPLGLELEKFQNSDKVRGIFRKILGITPEVMLVGIVGRLVPIKNHRMFLDVASRIKAMGLAAKVKFVVVGDGELKGILEKETKDSGLAGDVVFTGWIEDLTDVYADLDVVALTSLNEGTPVSLIEAMASARAVISTDVGGVRDVISDGVSGVLSAANDAADFTVKLADLLKDSGKRAELGLKARQCVCGRYTKERLIGDIRKVYEECFAEAKI